MNAHSLLMLQIATMLAVGLSGGYFARKLGFPAVIGELLGGVILGPTVFGAVAPAASTWLFPNIADVNSGRDALVRFSILFFLLAAGMEVDLSLLRTERLRIVWTSGMGIAIPFLSGLLAVFLFPALWEPSAAGSKLWFAIFLGTALSISALPVTARILLELNLLRERVGMVIMASAMMNDLIGWTLFALLLDHMNPATGTGNSLFGRLAAVIGLFILFLTVGRQAVQHLLKRLNTGRLPPVPLEIGLGMTLMLCASALVEALGVHPVFGAFMVGIAFGQPAEKRLPAQEAVYGVVMGFFAPLYFVSVGMKANFVTHLRLPLVLMVIAIACVGKIGGGYLGARIGKMRGREAVAVGFGLNSRGAMEMVLASVALDKHLIDEAMFVALVLMALVTSAISGPMLRRLLHPSAQTEKGSL
ncbi:MAG TPA: cation:proton antiporter [Chthonomonadaceae bacterium]|nr:cation:proton antiporter [Chthonomonadaceae bacterium]